MAANNNLNGYATKDLNEMKTGVANGTGLNGGRLIVYYASQKSAPRLIEINADGSKTVLKTYPSGNNLTITRMRTVISDTKMLAEADDYGLILWSHGTGWLNDGGVINEPKSQISPTSFGYDDNDGSKMKLTSLARAIDEIHWSFIYFDCCHMATVEVAYELRHLTDRIAASPTELGADGMPYDRNVRCFFQSEPDLAGAISNTFNFYTDGSLKSSPGCAISLINTSGLDELAAATVSIFRSGATPANGYQPVKYFRRQIMTTGIYDMYHYIHATGCDPTLIANWDAAFEHTVIKSYATDQVFGLNSDNFHGLGSQIINNPADANVYEYTDTSWWKDVVSKRFSDR